MHLFTVVVVQNLMSKYGIGYQNIGRLEVGTETIIDKSKSVKTVLMQLFQQSGNTAIEGIDTTNACYGGTSALFNAINWMESSSWDGRYALVVAGDIAVYASGSARPTGGCGVVAMLIGPDAPIVFDQGLRATHMEHVYDFYKPDLASEFPEVDGPETISCYLRALDNCYQRYISKLKSKGFSSAPEDGLNNFDYMCFHCPYAKLVQKSVGRLGFHDFLNNPDAGAFANLQRFRSVTLEGSYFNKELEKAFVDYTKPHFAEKVLPSLFVAKNVGNMYCGSLYGSLVSLLCEVPSEELEGKRVGLFSYGSGLAASMFSLRVVGNVDHIKKILNVRERLESRKAVEPAVFEKIMSNREETHNLRGHKPTGNVEDLFPGTFYLEEVDEKFRRTYSIMSKSCTPEVADK